jgi:acyl-CoA hydrolase
VADLHIAQYLQPGDTVLIGQAAAKPPALVEKFIAAAHAIDGLTAVGGQPGFLRAARQARSGLAILALAATYSDGSTSRIVPAVSSPVTTPQSDVDLVITEFGAADLRGTSYQERVERLIAVAAPQHRATLAWGRPPWL